MRRWTCARWPAAARLDSQLATYRLLTALTATRDAWQRERCDYDHHRLVMSATGRLREAAAVRAGFVAYAVDTQLLDLEANLAAIGVSPR